MIRILHVVSNMGCGGVQQMLMNYGRHAAREGIRFDFLVTKPGLHDAEAAGGGGRIFRAPGFQHPAAYVRYVEELLAAHPEYRIIEGHNGMLQAFALGAAKRIGVPVRIAHAHATAIPTDAHTALKWPLRPMVRALSTHKWACCDRAGVFFFGERRWRSEGRIVRNAVDARRFAFDPAARRAMRLRMGWENRLVVGHVGRLCHEKNQARLLDIFAQIRRLRPDAVLALVGEGADEAMLRGRAARLGVSGAVCFAGMQEETAAWYGAMDVLVMPSRAEGLPLTAVEAQASGLPCLLSTGITEEAALTGHVRFLPLSEEDARWVEQAVSLAGMRREDGACAVIQAGYGIAGEAEKLAAAYMRLYEEAMPAERSMP